MKNFDLLCCSLETDKRHSPRGERNGLSMNLNVVHNIYKRKYGWHFDRNKRKVQ